MRKRIVELMANLDYLSGDPVYTVIKKTVEEYKDMHDMTKEKAIKQVVKTRKEIIDHNLLPPLDEDPEMDSEFENIEDDNIQLSPLVECDPTVCLTEKPSGHTPTRVIIGILYRIFLHQTPSNRIPAALRKTPSD